MRSRHPGAEFEGKFRLTAGSFSQTNLAALASGPLNENWGAKLAVLAKDRDGYWRNLHLGGRHGQSRTTLLRPALSYAADGFDSILIAEFGNIEADGLGAIAWEVDGVQLLDPYDKRVTQLNQPGYSDLDWRSLSLESGWELWRGRLTSVAGYRRLEQAMVSDIDGHSDIRFVFAGGTFMKQQQTSLELRWSGDISNAITLTTGLYFFDQQYRYGERRLLNNSVDRRGVSSIKHDTQGIFAQADYRVSGALTLTLGGRYTQERKQADIGVIGDPNAVGNCATQTPPFEETTRLSDCRAALNDSEQWRNIAPKLGADWFVNDEVMLFASYTRGFRSGGYNTRFTDMTYAENPATAASSPGPYDEEVVDAFELGLKSTLLAGKLRLNASLFNNSYDDLQRTSLNASGGQEILNAASATIRGLEVDLTAAAGNNLVLQAGIGLIDAKYDDFDSAAQVTGKNAAALKFVMAPDYTCNLAATHDVDIGTAALTSRLSFTYVDDTYSDDYNRAHQKAYQLVDTSMTWSHHELGLKIAVYGKNVFDEVYYDFGTNFSSSSLAHQSYWLTPPRTYGVELTYAF